MPETLSGSLDEEGYGATTETIDEMAKEKPVEAFAEKQAAADLVRTATEQGICR